MAWAFRLIVSARTSTVVAVTAALKVAVPAEMLNAPMVSAPPMAPLMVTVAVPARSSSPTLSVLSSTLPIVMFASVPVASVEIVMMLLPSAVSRMLPATPSSATAPALASPVVEMSPARVKLPVVLISKASPPLFAPSPKVMAPRLAEAAVMSR